MVGVKKMESMIGHFVEMQKQGVNRKYNHQSKIIKSIKDLVNRKSQLVIRHSVNLQKSGIPNFYLSKNDLRLETFRS